MFAFWSFSKNKKQKYQLTKYWKEVEKIEKRYLELVSKFSFSNPKCLNLITEKRLPEG